MIIFGECAGDAGRACGDVDEILAHDNADDCAVLQALARVYGYGEHHHADVRARA